MSEGSSKNILKKMNSIVDKILKIFSVDIYLRKCFSPPSPEVPAASAGPGAGPGGRPVQRGGRGGGGGQGGAGPHRQRVGGLVIGVPRRGGHGVRGLGRHVRHNWGRGTVRYLLRTVRCVYPSSIIVQCPSNNRDLNCGNIGFYQLFVSRCWVLLVSLLSY